MMNDNLAKRTNGALALIFVLAFSAPVTAEFFQSSDVQAMEIAPELVFANPIHLTTVPECKGDLNHDGRVTFADIDPFVQFLHYHNAVDFWRADTSDDGFVDDRDIDAFVALLGLPPQCR